MFNIPEFINRLAMLPKILIALKELQYIVGTPDTALDTKPDPNLFMKLPSSLGICSNVYRIVIDKQKEYSKDMKILINRPEFIYLLSDIYSGWQYCGEQSDSRYHPINNVLQKVYNISAPTCTVYTTAPTKSMWYRWIDTQLTARQHLINYMIERLQAVLPSITNS